ncbi:MAG: methylenetetrahydrofolate reductase C-terminal domain-containing protein [Lentisphaerae bacterium]|nr:methylenetetrahydrofolate reductase C-terminal domain-containing protein [Lentisphaerota bacterium]
MRRLRDTLADESTFAIGAELVTTRGIIMQEDSARIAQFADELCQDEEVDWISVTDNAGGNVMLAPDHLARRIRDNGKNALIHITCKDNNRNALESTAWKYASEGFENLLVLSGDYPIDGFNGMAQPVFDIDSVGLLHMLHDMNQGLRIRGRKPNTYLRLDQTDFYLGCAVSPFKLTEAEQMMQYEKLKLKARCGAHFVIPQLGYDIHKFHELICFMRENDLNMPLIGNIYRLTAGVARIFNRGMIPGCVVSDGLLERVDKEKQSEDKGRAFFIDFAAKQFATFRGMGFAGAYIGGVNKHADFRAILDKAKEYEGADWKEFIPELTNPRPKEFFYYATDPQTGLADPGKLSEEYLGAAGDWARHVSPFYRFSRALHDLVFDYKAPLFSSSRKLFGYLEKHKTLSEVSYFNERMWKAALFECRECGDCSLPDVAYLCPQSQCAKNERNGPCGGSLADRCEVTKTGKDCIWVRAYARNKYFNGNSKPLLERPPIIKNNDLNGTSGWANCFLMRDHNAYLAQEDGSK